MAEAFPGAQDVKRYAKADIQALVSKEYKTFLKEKCAECGKRATKRFTDTMSLLVVDMLDSFWCPECGRVLCESHRHQHTCERLDQQKERNKHITKEQLQAEMAEAEARREAADEERRNAARRRAVEEDSQRQERKGRRLVLAQKARSVEGFLQGVSRDTDANERRGRRATDELLELYTRARRISLTLYNEYEHPSLPGLADEDWEGMKEIYARARELTGMHVMTEDGPLDMRNPWDPPPPPEEGGPADLDGAGLGRGLL
mmetsp:Transcript_15270/g.40715  ORF Transcript_15270/g.40715 Transcript_15270/m.40715 type:complete len:260 (-) Transcript_15270:288-1067(-)